MKRKMSVINLGWFGVWCGEGGMTEIKELKHEKEVNGAAPLNSSWKSLLQQETKHRIGPCSHLWGHAVFFHGPSSFHCGGVERSAA